MASAVTSRAIAAHPSAGSLAAARLSLLESSFGAIRPDGCWSCLLSEAHGISSRGSQLLILSKAAQRDDHAVEPPAELKGAAAQKVVRKLIKDGLLAEAEGGPDLPVWRREEDGRPVSLLITAAGLDAIGIAPEDREEGSEPETPPIAPDAVASSGDSASLPGEPDQAAKMPRAGTKLTAVVQLLERKGGASIGDLTATTGWLPHTARAALTGLRKRGRKSTPP